MLFSEKEYRIRSCFSTKTNAVFNTVRHVRPSNVIVTMDSHTKHGVKSKTNTKKILKREQKKKEKQNHENDCLSKQRCELLRTAK